MGCAEVQLFSNALGKWTHDNATVAEEGKPPLPVQMRDIPAHLRRQFNVTAGRWAS